MESVHGIFPGGLSFPEHDRGSIGSVHDHALDVGHLTLNLFDNRLRVASNTVHVKIEIPFKSRQQLKTVRVIAS